MPKHQIIIYDRNTGRLLRRVRHSKSIRVRIQPLAPNEAAMRAPLHAKLHGHRVVNGELKKHSPSENETPTQVQQITIVRNPRP